MRRVDVQPHWAKSFPRNPLEDWWLPRTSGAGELDDEPTPEEREALMNAVATCIENSVLDEIDQAVLETILLAQCSLRWASDMTGIPKTTVARRRDGLIQRLKECLSNEPAVAEYLDRHL